MFMRLGAEICGIASLSPRSKRSLCPFQKQKRWNLFLSWPSTRGDWQGRGLTGMFATEDNNALLEVTTFNILKFQLGVESKKLLSAACAMIVWLPSAISFWQPRVSSTNHIYTKHAEKPSRIEGNMPKGLIQASILLMYTTLRVTKRTTTDSLYIAVSMEFFDSTWNTNWSERRISTFLLSWRLQSQHIIQWIASRENVQEPLISWERLSMVFCRFSLKPIPWIMMQSNSLVL